MRKLLACAALACLTFSTAMPANALTLNPSLSAAAERNPVEKAGYYYHGYYRPYYGYHHYYRPYYGYRGYYWR